MLMLRFDSVALWVIHETLLLGLVIVKHVANTFGLFWNL